MALITDAGTPAVSDPGARAVARIQEAGFPVVPVPGACAAIAALSASGLTESCFWKTVTWRISGWFSTILTEAEE